MTRINHLLLSLVTLLACTQTSATAAHSGWMKSFDVDPAELATEGENPYFMLRPGFRLTLEGREGGDTVQLVITVLAETRQVAGIETRIVEERETKNGSLVEVSRNYFVINRRNRDVYYFGEEVDMFKRDKVVSHEGAWAHGSNQAHFGLMMPGSPAVGMRHFQELAPAVAMDRAEIVSLSERVTTSAGVFEGCLKVKETTPLERFAKEYKLYAPGIGLIRDGDLELVSYGIVPRD